MENDANISKYKNYLLNCKTGAEKTFRTLFEKGKIVVTKDLPEDTPTF